MLEGLLTELEALTKLSIVPAVAASGMASWLIFKQRAQLREFMMSRRRIKAKKEAEWSLIANVFAEELARLKSSGHVHEEEDQGAAWYEEATEGGAETKEEFSGGRVRTLS